MVRWQVNQEMLDQARRGELSEKFSLRFPVLVRQLPGGPAGMAGKYHGIGYWGPGSDVRLDEPHHHISVSAELSSDMANNVLWHELTHAMQGERYMPIEANGEIPYQVANRGLAVEFMREMKVVREKKGLSAGAMTYAYSDVSFEEEARGSSDLSKDFDLIEPANGEAATIGLLDDEGRFCWRVDVWEEHYDKKAKRRVYGDFQGTVRVWAKDIYGARRFAREQYDLDYNTSECLAYMIQPNKKGGDKNGK